MPAPRTPLESCLPNAQGKRRSRTRPQNGKKAKGRPKLNIDKTLVVEFAKLHCTSQEIAARLHIDVKTLDRHCGELIKEARREGKGNLRKWLWKNAEGGDTKAMIWLSKQHLGMKDKQDITSNGDTVSVKVLHGVDMNDI
jgi:hypothetical protein